MYVLRVVQKLGRRLDVKITIDFDVSPDYSVPASSESCVWVTSSSERRRSSSIRLRCRVGRRRRWQSCSAIRDWTTAASSLKTRKSLWKNSYIQQVIPCSWHAIGWQTLKSSDAATFFLLRKFSVAAVKKSTLWFSNCTTTTILVSVVSVPLNLINQMALFPTLNSLTVT